MYINYLNLGIWANAVPVKVFQPERCSEKNNFKLHPSTSRSATYLFTTTPLPVTQTRKRGNLIKLTVMHSRTPRPPKVKFWQRHWSQLRLRSAILQTGSE